VKKVKGTLLLLLAALIWGMAFVAQSSAADKIGAFTFNASRSIIAALFLLVVNGIRKMSAKAPMKTREKAASRQLAIGGTLCGIALFFAVNFQQFGIAAYPKNAAASGRAGFLTATYVVIVALCSWASGRKTHPMTFVATVGCLIGMYMLCLDSFKEFETQMNSEGLTAICNGGTSEVPNPKLWKFMDDYSKTGDMSMRVNFAEFASSYTVDGAKQCVDDLNAAQKYNSDYQHVSQVKLLIDGVPEGKTALLMDPYDPAAGMAADYRGPQYCTQDQLNQFVALVDKSGYQVFIHTMGDGGANMDLNAFEYAQKQNGKRDSRHTMVHANFVDKSDMPRMAALGVYAALQPIWAYFDPTFSGLEKKNLGADRFMKEYAVRDMVNAGITITGSADWPITLDNRPLSGIEVGVTQCSPYPGQQGDPTYFRNPNQTVTVMDMLKFFTINGAKQMFMDDKIGSLEVGKKADIVILAKDITKIDPKDISETEIIDTISNGRIVYSK